MPLGYCVNCDKQIFEIKNKRLRRPLGNYRSLKFKLQSGQNMIVPVCSDCHELDFNSEKMKKMFVDKLFNYLKSTMPNDWTEDKKNSFLKMCNMSEIKGCEKQGALKKEDVGGRIWL